MKTYIYSSLLLLMLIYSSVDSHAQQIITNKNNYVVLTKKVAQLQPILLTAEALKAEDDHNFGHFKVIICGKEIGDISDAEKIGDFIIKAKNTGVELIACGFSLNKFNIDTAKVPKDITTVENGILYNFQLQKKGYKSLSL